MRSRRYKMLLILMALAPLVLLSTAFFRQEVVSQNVWVLGVSLGGLQMDQARQVIHERIREIEGGPLVFSAGNRRCEISDEELKVILDESGLSARVGEYLASRPKFVPSFLFKKGPKTVVAAPLKVVSSDLEKVLNKVSFELSAPAMPKRYGFNGYVLTILPAEPGQEVLPGDVMRALESISGSTVEVPYRKIDPPESADVEPLSLIAEFSTEYDEKEVDRTVNLVLAAKAVHGKVLRPGEIYSFNKEAGERTAAKGYRYAPVVVDDHLEPGLAGGICQVTTTLFNAAAMAGLAFPQVHAHGIPVEYVPPGRDAAVAWDYMDLQIENTLQSPCVFGAWVEKGKVLVRVYGKPSGKTYELEPVVLKEYPEPGKKPGLLVETYIVTKEDGKMVDRKLLLRSFYKPSAEHPR